MSKTKTPTRVLTVVVCALYATVTQVTAAAPLKTTESVTKPVGTTSKIEKPARNGAPNGATNGNDTTNGKLNGSLDAERESRKRLEDPLTGIVINRTITVLGKDFYNYFVTAWRHLDGDNKYTITIFERPSARWGSEIWIEFRRTRMFHTFLSPARQAAREASEQAADLVYQNIMENEVRRALFKSPDLGEEEL
ncbi:curli production assembly/transport protein CsgE [Pusillimonas minor]|uniref:Curli production assembly/transport component CsgE n=1 Tax=Pusillimonas minor TaxID=2697024 RepID=A0A842HRR0_9BURK|nr:curli production assembly/transport protein CsgE [Pusillimonas minor]MBC2769535.1 curli production assembly/transport protein CsgE [Pusillimonas minor]